MMYDESGYFVDPHQDPNPIPGSLADSYYNELEESIRVSTFTLEELSNLNRAPSDGLDHLQHQLGFDLDHDIRAHLISSQQQSTAPIMHHSSWDAAMQESTIQHHHNFQEQQQNLQCYEAEGYPAAPDLLNLLQLPVAPNDGGSVMYDSSLHLGFPPPPPPPPQLRDLFNSLPQNYGLFFTGLEDPDSVAMAGVGDQFFHEVDGRQFDSAVSEYRRDGGGNAKGEGGVSFVTERHRRDQLNKKYTALRSLIPNPTKTDRASIVGDSIEYIKELRRTVEELKMLVDQKRRRGRRNMKAEDEATVTEMESSSMRPMMKDMDEHHVSDTLRSSWIQRRSKESFVDVHIIDDEVNIKLTQKRRVSCLLSIAKALDDLQLDLVHVTGGYIADHYIFMFNAKICEGSSIYAGGIANKLLGVMERSQHQPFMV